MYSEYYTEENGHKIDAEKYVNRNSFEDSNTILKSPNKKTSSNASFVKLDVIKGIFLLILAISGNFLAETMGCQMQKLLTNNMFAKNIIILMVIYFALGFASDQTNPHPWDIAKQTLFIWVFFLIFNKMDVYYTTIVTILLFSILLCIDYLKYYKTKNEKENNEKIVYLEAIVDKIVIVTLLITIVGFFIYFSKQRSDHSESFSYTKFILGSPKCENL